MPRLPSYLPFFIGHMSFSRSLTRPLSSFLLLLPLFISLLMPSQLLFFIIFLLLIVLLALLISSSTHYSSPDSPSLWERQSPAGGLETVLFLVCCHMSHQHSASLEQGSSGDSAPRPSSPFSASDVPPSPASVYVP